MKRIILAALLLPMTLQAKEYSLPSPDGKVIVRVTTDTLSGTQMRNYERSPFWHLSYDGKPFMNPSRLGLSPDGAPPMARHFEVADVKYSEHRAEWKPLYGEKSLYPDNYNQMRVVLRETVPPARELAIVFRAYNEGAALRYEMSAWPGGEEMKIMDELTEFAFAPETYVWEEYGHEGLYHKTLSSQISRNCELPLTVLTPAGVYGAIAEAGGKDYPRAYMNPAGQPGRETPTVCIALRSQAVVTAPFASRWRTVTLGEKPGDLMERNYLLLNLNETNKIDDTSWIKPGKAFREVTQSTSVAYQTVDWAVERDVDYIIFDWGWYGPHNDESNEPSKVNVVNTGTGRPVPGHEGLELQKIIDYAKTKGVGVFLYVNRQGLERYADVIFPLYQSWGVAGIKPGFVNVGSQGWNAWNEEIVRKAAAHRLMVNIHDAYRPTGFSRTYPNLMTQEGIHGNEQNPDATHSAMLPFVRFTIGAADFTPGYFKKALKTRWAHKLSLPILFYSPVQFLHWTERLTDMEERSEMELWRELPTTWDDTKVLLGEIGLYASVARRKADVWYVGTITNNDARKLSIPLDFLDAGKRYKATVWEDNPAGTDAAQPVTVREITVDRNTVIEAGLLSSGGQSIRLVPIRKSDKK